MRRLIVPGLLSTILALAQTGPTRSASVNSAEKNASGIPHFEDIRKQAGLNVAQISSPQKRYIVESVSGGIGFIDCDGDGKLDLIAVNG